MNTRTVTDPKLALHDAIDAILAKVHTHGHPYCHLGEAGRFTAIHQQPGTVPKGAGPAVCALLRGEGFTVTLADLHADDPGKCGHTRTEWATGWDGRWRRLSAKVEVEQSMSKVAQMGTLLHEAGHVLLSHPHPDSDLPEGDPEAEVAVELASAAVMRTAGFGGEGKYLDYLSHATEGITDRSVGEARALARRLWPVVEPYLI